MSDAAARTTRRSFLLGSAGLAATIGAGTGLRRLVEASPRYLTASADAEGRFFLSAFDDAGALRFRFELPTRGHGIAVDPSRPGRAVVFDRRPGDLAHGIDVLRGDRLGRFEAGPGRHFYGHGVFAPDGSVLFATQNDYASGRGVIGIHDASNGKRLGEIPSHGVGPHEVRLLSDGRTLVVANGGIRTHPDRPREKLNLAGMAPSLAYVDAHDGRLLGAYLPSDPKLSVRHLDVDADDRVAVAMQYEGDSPLPRPLLAGHHGGDALQPVAGGFDWAVLEGYLGSVAFASGRGIAAVTSPRANRIEVFDLVHGAHLGGRRMRDVCGVAWAREEGCFVATTGAGFVRRIDPDAPARDLGARIELPGTRCDNHLGVAFV